jgi:hypothetical protein
MLRKLIVAGLLLAALLFPGAVRSQAVVSIAFLEVDLWPEYDRSSVLVIYRVTLSPNTTLPAQLALRIPAAAGEPYAVAVRQPDGQLVNLDYDLQSDGVWTSVEVVANLPELQIEYYDPSLVKSADQRSFTFQWPGGYAVEQMVVEFQQPLGASGAAIMPGPSSSLVNSQDGLTYLTKEIGVLDAGQTISLDIAYLKTSDTLTKPQLEVQPSAPLTTEPDWQNTMLGALPWVLGVLGVGLIAGGVFWYWKSGQATQAEKPRRRRSRSMTTGREDEGVAGVVYCHQCGKRAGETDRFCRSCGTKLRIE